MDASRSPDAPIADLEAALDAGDAAATKSVLEQLPTGATARVVDRLNERRRGRLIELLDPEDSAELLESLPQSHAVDIIDQAAAPTAAAIVTELPSDAQADLVGRLDPDNAAEILDQLDEQEADSIRALCAYPADTAGGLMITEIIRFAAATPVPDVVENLRANVERYADFDVQYLYVVDVENRLVGVLPLRDLVMSPPDRRIQDVMIADPHRLQATDTLDTMRHTFDRYTLFGLPVVDEAGQLLGVVRRADVEERDSERAESAFLRFAGIIGGDEFRTMPFYVRSLRRLSWLSANILLNVIAASVIALYQDTIAAVIALAVFLPIISDMSGCAGNQSVAVSLRELTLGLITPREAGRAMLKDALVGLVNGCVLGLLLGGVAYLWQQDIWLGLVVGGALACNTLLSATLGGLIPMLLRILRVDPALASGPILTTITDLCGFLLTLGFATAALPYLVPG